MSSPTKPLAFNSPRADRASPFARSPSLSPEKSNPFVRRSSVMTTGDRPRSPFARPANRLSVVEPSSSRPSTSDSLAPPISFSRHASPSPSVERDHSAPPSPSPASRIPESPLVNRVPESPTEEETPLSQVAPPSPTHLASPTPLASPIALASPAISPIATRQPRPAPQRTVTSSTQATIRPPIFTTTSSGRPTSRDSTTLSRPALTTQNSFSATSRNARPTHQTTQMATGQYSHIPQPLFHSMRESFEVLDSSNTGTITSASVSELLSQMGMDNSPRILSTFFPPNSPSTISLGKFLDLLSGPLQELSMPDELAAAFAAFDVDDSGQIDKAELRDALLNTAPEPGSAPEEPLTEQEVDGILAQYSARRAFGAKGVFGKELGAHGGGQGHKTRGEVFRYKDFMASVSGSGGAGDGADQVAA